MRATGRLGQVYVRERHSGIRITSIAGGKLRVSGGVPAARPHNLRLNIIIHQYLEELPAPGLVIHTVGNGITAEHHTAKGLLLRTSEHLGIILRCPVTIGLKRRRSLDAHCRHIVGVHRVGMRDIEWELRL